MYKQESQGKGGSCFLNGVSEPDPVIDYNEKTLLIRQLNLVCCRIILLTVFVGPIGDVGKINGNLM